MVGTLVSDIEARPEVQKLLLAIQNSVAANEGAAIAKQGSSCVVGSLISRKDVPEGTSGMHSSTLRRAVRCRHSCGAHLEVMDPDLWGTLPKDLVQLALVRLSIAEVQFGAQTQGSMVTTGHKPIWSLPLALNANNTIACLQFLRNLKGKIWYN